MTPDSAKPETTTALPVSPENAPSVSRFATARGAFVLAMIMTALCWISIHYTRQPGGLANLWAASGFLTGVLLTTRTSRWTAYFIVALLVNCGVRLYHADTYAVAIYIGVVSSLEALAVAYAVRRFGGDVGDTSRILSVSKVATISSIAATLASGLATATLLASLGRNPFVSSFLLWFAVHLIGMVIFATLTVVARVEGRNVFGRSGQRTELFLSIVLVTVTAVGVFAQSRYPLLFLVLPVLLLAAFRHRFSGFVLGTTIVALVALVATINGHGPMMLSTDASPAERTFLLQLFIASLCALTLPVVVVLTQRSWLQTRLADSEGAYRMLAEYSRDMVVRIDGQGHRKYISPAATEILGWSLDELREERWDLIHPDDRTKLMVAIAKLRVEGGTATILYRVQHRDGHYIWIEAHARLVPESKAGEGAEIIYAGRDISRRMKAEHDLARNQRRLRAITDNTPAFIIHLDTEECYTFANAYTGQMLGVHPSSLIGRSIKDIASPEVYAEIKPYIDRALRGERVTFESERDYQGSRKFFECTYIPDRAPDGEILGFYGMVFDITHRKLAERELASLARHDSLTGLANRLHFNERMALAVARRQRKPSPIALLYLDIDKFKHINDTLGHAVGDTILVEFAHRLREAVRETDVVARLGGDEFVILVEDLDSADVAAAIARKLMEKLSSGIEVNGKTVPVTTSVGIAYRERPVANGEELMRIADDALYAAKAAGRNAFRLVTESSALV